MYQPKLVENFPYYLFILFYYMNRTPSTKNRKKRKRDRQTDNRMQSARGQILHNVRKVTDGEHIRQA